MKTSFSRFLSIMLRRSPSFRQPRYLGTVEDAGGGAITFWVDHDMMQYPEPGARIYGYITGDDVWSAS